MHYRAVIALLFSFAVALCSCDAGPWHGVVKKDAPFNFTVSPLNFIGIPKLTVQATLPVYVCIVFANFSLPKYTEYSVENCLVYHNATAENNDYDVPLLYHDYMVGVYLSIPEADIKDQNSTVSLTLVGQDCKWGEFGMGCVPSTNIENTSYPFTQGEDKYFIYHAPQYSYEEGLVSRLSFQATLEEGGLVSEDLLIYARYLGTPSALVHDAIDNANGTLIIETPRPGPWVFYVHPIQNGTYTFHIMEEKCPQFRGGANCEFVIEPAFNNMTLTITSEKGARMLWFRTMTEQGLLISVTTSNNTDIPYIYANRWQVPVVNDKEIIADVRNCNRNYCSLVRSIAHNSTNEDWYIAIAPSTSGNITYALWFNTSCVPECETENHGECKDSGLCDCEIDFEGIDCSISKGLGPQYIVLIIIASLVVASAIIGFVAWAYMRRKRANYEIVS
jgi:hypothetical protein